MERSNGKSDIDPTRHSNPRNQSKEHPQNQSKGAKGKKESVTHSLARLCV